MSSEIAESVLEEDRKQIQSNLESIRSNIASACEKSDRNPEDVSICVVTKTRPIEAIHAVVEEGISVIGENRVQEAERKFARFPEQADLHLIGHLQSNKTSTAVQVFDMVQSVDRPKIVDSLQRHCQKRDIQLPVMVQVNVSGEESKHGCPPEEVEEILQKIADSDNLNALGFMTMAPYREDPEETRPVFANLRKIRDQMLDQGGDQLHPDQLSMGMTSDYEVAIEEGATMIRPGRAVFKNTQYV